MNVPSQVPINPQLRFLIIRRQSYLTMTSSSQGICNPLSSIYATYATGMRLPPMLFEKQKKEKKKEEPVRIDYMLRQGYPPEAWTTTSS